MLVFALVGVFGFAFLGATEDPGQRSVLLFKKPTVSTGRLEVVEDGLAVLRAQREPFAIISAVGPTRTGKSSMLGRAFFRGENENIFQSGSGMTSFTGGVWITSQPIKVDTGRGKLQVLLIDTEGFSGVGSLTSKTYEANLFGIIYLISSAIIFNTMFPVDASTVANLNAHSSHALQMLQALKEAGLEVRRAKPRLIWSVQSFNVYNLRNSGMEAEDLFATLRNASRPARSADALAVLGEGASSASAWLVERLFEEQRLVPVRRPHMSDEIVANMAEYGSSELSHEYLHDIEHVRLEATRHLQPIHRCKELGPDQRLHLHLDHCTAEAWSGNEFVPVFSKWLKEGFVLDHSDLEVDKASETENLFKLGERNRDWLDEQCKSLNNDLRFKFYWYRERTPEDVEKLKEAYEVVDRMMKSFRDASLSRLVESGVFWKYPGKGAMLIETQSIQAMQRCRETLENTRLYMENWMLEREARRTEAVLPPPIEEGRVQYKLQASDSSCFSIKAAHHRVDLARQTTLAACAEAASTNCACGRGFEFDETNVDANSAAYCACGAAGTANKDCTEDFDDFSYGSKRYLLYNVRPACKDEEAASLTQGKPNGENAHEAANSGGDTLSALTTAFGRKSGRKKVRQVCFDIYEEDEEL